MVNVDKLRGKIVEQRVSMRELAHELRLDRSTLYRRFSENGCTFTIAEADIIARKLRQHRTICKRHFSEQQQP